VTDASPADPLPRPMKLGGVVFGLIASDEQAATVAVAMSAAGRSQLENEVGRISLARLCCLSIKGVFSVEQAGQQRDSLVG
jgi:hypothetical protein